MKTYECPLCGMSVCVTNEDELAGSRSLTWDWDGTTVAHVCCANGEPHWQPAFLREAVRHDA